MRPLHWARAHWPSRHWASRHWPIAGDGTGPTSPGGAGTFEIQLDGQATVTYAWMTALEKHLDGTEHRASIVDDPAVRYAGEALLAATGAQTRSARTRLARSAALGSPFLLGLPYEALALRADSTALTVAVFAGPLALADWAVPGVRVLVSHKTYGSTQAVIQSVTADAITVQTEGTPPAPLGDVGRLGAVIMPLASIFLDAQQSFERYQPSQPVERWKLQARNADAGLKEAGTAATLALTGIFAGLTIVARTPGTQPLALSYFGGGSDPAGVLTETSTLVEVQYQTSVTTIAEFVSLVGTSQYVRITGSVADDSLTIGPGNILDAEPLTGGTDAEVIEAGIGATLVEYRESPVWNRKLVINDTVVDSLQAMALVQDLGALPFAVQTAKVPDWGRGVAMQSMLGDEWQWAKRMLWTLKGRFASFWLPTWRRDLMATAVGIGTLTVSDGDANGDVRTWFPQHRRDLQVIVSGVVQYVRIASATNNGDGTTTLAVVDEADAPVTLAGVPSVVSWLELCHLESDEVAVTFAGRTFGFALQARVTTGEIDEEEREGIEIIMGMRAYRLATGTRDIEINGQKYTAYPSAREEIKLATSENQTELTIRLPMKHAVPQRWLAFGSPPKTVEVNVYRKKLVGGDVRRIWTGYVTSLGSTDNNATAVLTVPSRATAMLNRRLPTILVGRICPHILYDTNCQAPRAGFEVSTTVTEVRGRSLKLASIGGKPGGWADGGEMLHVASDERMSVFSQAGVNVQMRATLVELRVGDAVKLYAGCAHDVGTCHTKFNNRVRFGGFPQLNTINPFAPTGFGVYTSE